MSEISHALYVGNVVHKRHNPISHGLNYRVFSLLVDCAKIDDLGQKLRLFSRNKFNLFSLYDSDYGDGSDLQNHLHEIARKSGVNDNIQRFMMLCYPRVLGYVFNPITVYFGLNADDETVLAIYEVTNTFGERKSYVVPAQADATGHIWQQCPKQFFVSPFNKVSGTYTFHLSPIANEITLGVALKDKSEPVLRAHFRGKRQNLSDANLLKALGHAGLMTVKVMLAIHFEAAKIWLKGLRTHDKPAPPAENITYFADALSGQERQ